MAINLNPKDLRNDSVAILRIGCGLVALISGIMKFTAPAMFAAFLGASPLGFAFGPSMAAMPIIGLVEIVVGALLILGLYTRPVSYVFAAWAVAIALVTLGGLMTINAIRSPTVAATPLPWLTAVYHLFLVLPAALLLAAQNAGKVIGLDRNIPQAREERRPRVTMYPEERKERITK